MSPCYGRGERRKRPSPFLRHGCGAFSRGFQVGADAALAAGKSRRSWVRWPGATRSRTGKLRRHATRWNSNMSSSVESRWPPDPMVFLPRPHHSIPPQVPPNLSPKHRPIRNGTKRIPLVPPLTREMSRHDSPMLRKRETARSEKRMSWEAAGIRPAAGRMEQRNATLEQGRQAWPFMRKQPRQGPGRQTGGCLRLGCGNA